MSNTRAYAAAAETSPLGTTTIERRVPTDQDVQIEILFCGVCHSDLHQTRNEWRDSFETKYPCVPGHEIVGRITKAGAKVAKFKTGDLVAVGCMVDSCGVCEECKSHLEQFCKKGPTLTYNSSDRHTGGYTFGGYAEDIVVDQRFILKVPENLDPAAVAPLLCAGITTYSPLRHWNVGPGRKAGVVGLGGLGHMAVKFARAFGAHVVLFTTSPGKVEDGKRLGADEVVVSKNEAEMKAHEGSFDFILDCVSAQHDLNSYLKLLKHDGALVIVGAPEKPLPVNVFNIIFGRKTLAGSMIGGIAETQEMLDFCGQKGITSDVEVIAIQKINEAYDRLLKSDVKYRFVIDMATIR